ncbi:DNA-binding MarR family transcriptional regulator [Jatrophihabitans sp. GAS493]|uniref:MarR family winged helix-turn-helix transcriptional regulator n=1 Tax=Jatrophihabitans sp. GAS493 TaxID=1907575 RepID=UPI000BB779C4|nr:MarR family transcriptional regulator [Jatrophihabitans sp. GAS493]SOD71638.1 DNA-binding MarR family transcriptional regulator [Jatrophihabitans sp. GAS493]
MTESMTAPSVTAPVRASGPAAAETEVSPSMAAIEPLTRSFGQVMRSAGRMKHQIMTAARSEVEFSAYILIATLMNDGPMRASALAELVHSDPSTVSRQVAGLIKDGLVERQIDPRDGRASLLAATERGRGVCDKHARIRNTRFQAMLEGWTDEECLQFSDYLDRLSAAFELRGPTFVAEAARSASSAPLQDDAPTAHPSELEEN